MMSYDGFGFGFMEAAFPIIFVIIAAIVIGGFIAVAVKGIRGYAKNEASPVLTVEAKLITKRDRVTGHSSSMNDSVSGHTSTHYYVTFEVKSGDRMEFNVEGEEYGLLAEGDSGQLTFQGTRYMGFKRNKELAAKD